MRNPALIADLLERAVIEAQSRREETLRAGRRAREEIAGERHMLQGEGRLADLGDSTELRAFAGFAARRTASIRRLETALADIEAQDRALFDALHAAFARKKKFDIYRQRRKLETLLKEREKQRRYAPRKPGAA